MSNLNPGLYEMDKSKHCIKSLWQVCRYHQPNTAEGKKLKINCQVSQGKKIQLSGISGEEVT